MTEDEMVGWHHQLDGHEFEQALGVADGYQPWDFFGRDDAKAETPVLWTSHAKS